MQAPAGPRKPPRGRASLAERVGKAGVTPAITPSRLLRRARARTLHDTLSGKLVVVTGGSSGIGEATARRFAGVGANVIVVARGAERLGEVARGIRADGGVAHAYPCDLSDLDAIGELVTRILAEHGPVDLLVNNAGRSIRRAVVDSFDRMHDYQRTMQINYFGPVALVLGLLPGMVERGSGQVINISTWGTQTTAPMFSAYVASKAALDAFSRSTNAELRTTGVKITTIHMPLVRTPMISPSQNVYRGVPSLSADEAAELVAEAVVTRPTRVQPAVAGAIHLIDAVTTWPIDRGLMGGRPSTGAKAQPRER
jgi:NAD(P)-dependent dehydrogenase (short-subunit alcohol dehydrogenase family)